MSQKKEGKGFFTLSYPLLSLSSYAQGYRPRTASHSNTLSLSCPFSREPGLPGPSNTRPFRCCPAALRPPACCHLPEGVVFPAKTDRSLFRAGRIINPPADTHPLPHRRSRVANLPAHAGEKTLSKNEFFEYLAYFVYMLYICTKTMQITQSL